MAKSGLLGLKIQPGNPRETPDRRASRLLTPVAIR